MANLIYNSAMSVLDRDSGMTLPWIPGQGCPQITPAMIGTEVMNEECVGFISPNKVTPAGQAAVDSYQAAKNLFSVKPPTAESSMTPSAADVSKIINQLTGSGLQIYGATQAQRPKGTGSALQQAPSGSGAGVVLAVGVVGLGLLGVGLALSRKPSAPAKIAEAPKLVANKVRQCPVAGLAALAAGLVVYKLWGKQAAKAQVMADLSDEVDWLANETDGYALNLVGGGSW